MGMDEPGEFLEKGNDPVVADVELAEGRGQVRRNHGGAAEHGEGPQKGVELSHGKGAPVAALNWRGGGAARNARP